MGVVMGLLVISFAIWGIGDIFRGFGRSTVATIGSTEISVEQFRQAYNDRLSQLGRQFGRPITRDQARALGLDRQLLSEMIAQAGLDERARQMRLAISDEDIARRIHGDPSFHGPNGQFDRVRFEQLIRNAGYTEQRFVSEQRRITLRRQIIETVSGGVPVPKAWLEAINRFQNEQRSIEYVTFDSAQAGDIPAPTNEQLQTYFNERKAQFRAPEYRKIVVIDATPAELAKSVEVSEEDVKKAFEERRSRRSSSPPWRKRKRRPNGSNPASRSPRWRKSAGSRKRTPISARSPGRRSSTGLWPMRRSRSRWARSAPLWRAVSASRF
jgi:peptidyl-prolyl cis-trans isomerase D